MNNCDEHIKHNAKNSIIGKNMVVKNGKYIKLAKILAKEIL